MTRDRIIGIVFVLTLLVQLLVPARALLVREGGVRTDFTWDMFAIRRDCETCEIVYSIGDREEQRVSWGLRAPNPIVDREIDESRRAEWERFGAGSRGALLAHEARPAINVRATPQVARLKTADRLPRVALELCESLRTTLAEARRSPQRAAQGTPRPTPQWARRAARGAGEVRVRVRCECRYNNGPLVTLSDETIACGP